MKRYEEVKTFPLSDSKFLASDTYLILETFFLHLWYHTKHLHKLTLDINLDNIE